MGWHGTWISSLAIWLSRTSLTITGGEGLRPLCEHDLCLVDMVSEEHKAMMAQGCHKREAWRLSEITDMPGVMKECQRHHPGGVASYLDLSLLYCAICVCTFLTVVDYYNKSVMTVS
jgi:hypothetical protein